MPHMEVFSSIITLDKTCTRELYSVQLQPPSPPPVYRLEACETTCGPPEPKRLTFVPFDPAASVCLDETPRRISPHTYDIAHTAAGFTIWSSQGIADQLQLVRWLGTHTTIPVPRLEFDGFDTARQEYYAVFASPQGAPLSEAWDTLSAEARMRVRDQLRSTLKQLRAISPEKLPNHGIKDAFLDRRDSVVPGPFTSPKSFLAAVAARIDAIGAIYNPGPTRRAVGFIEALDTMATDQGMVMTHGNLHPENIWVDETGRVTAITDWSQAGYAPVFWEYVKACLSDDELETEFGGLYDGVLQPWPLHLAVMTHAHGIIW